MNFFLIVLGYVFMGASVKYVDQVRDARVFDPRWGWLLVLFSGVLMAFFMYSDVWSATILVALIAGNFVAGKIDALEFKTMVAVALLLPITASLLFDTAYFTQTLDWFVFSALALAGLLDEKANDLSDKKKLHHLVHFFFHHRVFTPLVLVWFVVLSILPFMYLLAFLGFDLAYTMVEKSSTCAGNRSLE